MIQDSEALEQLRKIRSDPIEFMKAVRTIDPSDPKHTIKPFPWDLEYIQFYTRIWQNTRLILVPKSRRLMLSWTNIVLFTWDAMFNVGRHHAFVSKKEDDSDELVKRAKFIIENLDTDIVPKDFIPKIDYTYCKLKITELHSLIEGFPSGSDQLRQYTFSGIFADEMAFWADARKMYSACYPTIEASETKAGGKFVGVSSAAPGFFEQMVHDLMDEGLTEADVA